MMSWQISLSTNIDCQQILPETSFPLPCFTIKKKTEWYPDNFNLEPRESLSFHSSLRKRGTMRVPHGFLGADLYRFYMCKP